MQPTKDSNDANGINPVPPQLTRILRDHVHERLRQAIVSGRFAYGERLNERHLAEILGVSTTPVKDAIRILEGEGLVRTAPRRGVFVEFSPLRAMEMALARAALEGVMAHIAANRLTDADVVHLRCIIDEMEQATAHSALEELVRLNEHYHSKIHSLSGSSYLEKRLDGQRTYDRAQRLSLLSEKSERQQGFEEHLLIFDALAARNPYEAELRMKRHIIYSAKRHMQVILGADTSNTDYDI